MLTLLAIMSVLFALYVIHSNNVVHSLMSLIVVFFISGLILIRFQVEYLGYILLIVYVGAVAVLFLFVVMMLNVNFKNLRTGFLSYLPFGTLIGVVMLTEIGLMIGTWKYKDSFIKTSEIKVSKNLSNTEALGNVLYTDFVHYFQISGLILLVAMVGAILLTFRKKDNLKRQDITKQVSREREEGVSLKEVESFKGVNLND